MLIEFRVENFRSIKDEQVLTMVKGPGDELSDSNSFVPGAPSTTSLLRSAAIYGANAAGKSNVIRSLKVMREIVIDSASKGQRGDKLDVEPFRLCSSTETAPSVFEVSFVANGVRYQFGFAATSERIMEEWLFAYPKGKPQSWYHRLWESTLQRYQWKMGASLLGQKQLWQESTRPNALFLSTAVQLNSAQLEPLYDWFANKLKIAGVGGWSSGFTASVCEDSAGCSRVLEFLNAADIAIKDIVVETEEFSESHIPDEVPKDVRTKILQEMKNKTVFEVKSIHETPEGKKVEFSMEEESDGTQKLFSFAGPWLDSLQNGNVLLIDELHDNFHPKIVQYLVDLFHSPEFNSKNAQLIFTTHETSILNQSIFRRDQVWFCEKNRLEASILFPLTDFRPRKGRENLEAAYLSGRYGALPHIKVANYKGLNS